jgi:transcriptional regulator with XRE-family HTH domain
VDGNFAPAMSRELSPESTEMVAERLRLTREALGLNQAEIARRAGMTPTAWNNAETGDNRIGIGNAIKLRNALGLSLDWIYFGNKFTLPGDLAEKIGSLEAPQRPSKRA